MGHAVQKVKVTGKGHDYLITNQINADDFSVLQFRVSKSAIVSDKLAFRIQQDDHELTCGPGLSCSE